MVTEQVEPDVGYIISELTSRIRSLENKNDLLAERMLMINKNMIEEYKKIIKELRLINSDLNQLKRENMQMRDVIKNAVKEMDQFAKKEQVLVVEKYIELLNPTRFITYEQVESLIEEKEIKGAKR